MITNFKIFEKALQFKDISIKVENSVPPLLDYLIEELSFIYHKQNRKPRALRVDSIEGYFNKRTLKRKDEYLETNLKIKTCSNPSKIEDTIDATVLFKSNFGQDEYTFTIKINNDIVYDINSDEEKDYNKKLVELVVKEYKKHLKSKNWKLKNA